LYPKNGSQFVLDPEQSPLNQQVKFEVETAHNARKLTLLIDGTPTAHFPKSVPVFWSLQAGRHLAAIRDDRGRQSSTVEIEVRAIEKP
jgi:hypothetical protein